MRLRPPKDTLPDTLFPYTPLFRSAILLKWVREFEPSAPREFEPLMGWTSSSDTRAQLRLRFDTLEEAIAYAQQEGLMYSVERPRERKVKPKVYADNFKYERLGRWTH